MDATLHQTSASNRKQLLGDQLEQQHQHPPDVKHDANNGVYDDNDDDEHSADLSFELQMFSEADDDMLNDDATASITDSCSSRDDGWLDDYMSEENAESDDEESCCSFYDDEQDLACLQEAYHTAAAGERGVRFAFVEVREYASTLGDHPCTRDSCPITLDWKHARGYKREINAYENSRYFMRSSYPRKLSPEERRRRIRETSRISRNTLREMELDAAMSRLELSTTHASDFWREIDEQQEEAIPESDGLEHTGDSLSIET